MDNFRRRSCDFIENSDIKFVDLGLSVLWATCNIGAESPEQTGLYFSWGNTDGHEVGSGYSFSNTNYNKTTGYNKSNDFEGDPVYDASTTIFGELWSTPNKSEAEELVSKCTWNAETYHGVAGFMVTSNVTGYEDKSIFIPATGSYNTTTLNRPTYAIYWTSTCDLSTNNKAYRIIHNTTLLSVTTSNRYYGYAIRAVYKPKVRIYLHAIDGSSVSNIEIIIKNSNNTYNVHTDSNGYAECVVECGLYTISSYSYTLDVQLISIREDSILNLNGGGKYVNVSISVSSEDGSSVVGLVVTIDGEQFTITESDLYITHRILLGKQYTINVNSKSGYITPSAITDISYSSGTKYYNFIYKESPLSTSGRGDIVDYDNLYEQNGPSYITVTLSNKDGNGRYRNAYIELVMNIATVDREYRTYASKADERIVYGYNLETYSRTEELNISYMDGTRYSNINIGGLSPLLVTSGDLCWVKMDRTNDGCVTTTNDTTHSLTGASDSVTWTVDVLLTYYGSATLTIV